jgi:hypothetical protein
MAMSSETRTLILVLGVLGVCSCCCMCVPVGLFVFSPAIMRAQQAAAEAEARRAAQQARNQRPVPPPRTVPPAGMPTAMPPTPPAFEPPPITLTPDFPPAESPPRSFAPKAPTIKSRPEGYAGLSEMQRKSIYRSATVYKRMKESLQKQEATMRSRGLDTSTLKKMMAEQDARQESERQRVADRYKLSSEEIDKILREGRDKGW